MLQPELRAKQQQLLFWSIVFNICTQNKYIKQLFKQRFNVA